jgi:hypothetical protein
MEGLRQRDHAVLGIGAGDRLAEEERPAPSEHDGVDIRAVLHQALHRGHRLVGDPLGTFLDFLKSGNDLQLDFGTGDKVTLKDWYAATPLHSVSKLQVVTESTADYNAASADPIYGKKANTFDFAALVQAFDEARAADAMLTRWNAMHKLLDAHLAASDTEALGGDLAYQYNLNGTLAGIGWGKAQEVVANAGFGAQAQALQPLASLQEGAVRLV